ncbi:MAG: hypothetical protein KFH98_06800, partial [Gemmatimonadetes bacterium]|nr:hypothetical protein [Gemmatimonadota bacterium]
MKRLLLHTSFLSVMLVAGAACDAQRVDDRARPGGDGFTAEQVCRTVDAAIRLPVDVHETSGLAISTHDPLVLWTHNDRGHGPVLYAVGADGRLVARVHVTGAESVDWEDLEIAPCESGVCLYIADIGDNNAVRDGITIYEVPEPALNARASAPARALHARYPDGARDAESLFILPGGDMYIITKGTDGPVILYRYPVAARGESGVVLERVREAMAQPQHRMQYVTGATTVGDGSRVAIRTYGSIHFHASEDLVGGGVT